MFFRQIFDPKLAQYAYLIGCQQTGEAVVIDPERDIDQYVEMAEQEGLTITAVTETHIHADYLSGAREFAHAYPDVKLYVSDEGDENWKYEWAMEGDYDVTFMKDGDSFMVGNIEIKAQHTPGHTPEHIIFLVTDHGGGATEPMGAATGDFLFVGDLGRPDLLESAAKVSGMMEPSARLLYKTVQEMLSLPDHLQIWPGHGAGSACGKALGAVPQSTMGYERKNNAALDAAARGEDAFVSAILEGQPEPPLYFARMKKLNKEGPPILGELPQPTELSVEDLSSVVSSEEAIVIDTREDREAFMKQHLPGSIVAPLNRAFNTAIGSVVTDAEAPLYLIIDEDDVEEAVRDLIRIGFDNIAGFATPETLSAYIQAGNETDSIPYHTIAQLNDLRKEEGADVLDVRYASEYESGHVDGALNSSYTRLPENADELPRDRKLLVHCGSGARAAVAASFLKGKGFDVALVDGEFAEYRQPVAA